MTPTICLNMIVKNESKIIERLLNSVVSFIDSYCICDTGSTDGTEEIIYRFFHSRNIKGKIIHEPFRDFGYNRTVALKACHEIKTNADYILLLDADMQLSINASPEYIKSLLNYDGYYVLQGNDGFYNRNIRIIRNYMEIDYWGVTHEYVNFKFADYKISELNKDILFIYDIGDGGSKQDKYERDIRLLKKSLIELPNEPRYLFYLANSYKDTNQYELAIETYKKRIEVGGWNEEIWYSYYSIGTCEYVLGNVDRAIFNWMFGIEIMPERFENIYYIIKHYRETEQYQTAYLFYSYALDKQRNRKTKLDYLFLEKDIYDWKLDYEMTVIGFYINPEKIPLFRLSMLVLSYPYLDHQTFGNNLLQNYKFYSPKIESLSQLIYFLPSKSIKSINKKMKQLPNITDIQTLERNSFVNSTPTFCMLPNGNLLLNTRFVNYRILEDGSYQNDKHITTINILSTFVIHSSGWIKIKEEILDYDKKHDCLYVGLEDVRLFTTVDGKILYMANRGIPDGRIKVEHGEIISNQESWKTIHSTLLDSKNNQQCEKNWVLFEDSTNKLKIVKTWFPLVVGDVIDSIFHETHFLPVPSFFQHLRGSTNGIRVGNDIWFICHLVSFENRRFYYHIFVVMDSETYMIKNHSVLFTFEGSPVEYTTGFLYSEKSNEFLIGYSIMDRETKIITISKQNIEMLF